MPWVRAVAPVHLEDPTVARAVLMVLQKSTFVVDDTRGYMDLLPVILTALEAFEYVVLGVCMRAHAEVPVSVWVRA
jgi:hypothetical protein